MRLATFVYLISKSLSELRHSDNRPLYKIFLFMGNEDGVTE